MIDIKLENVQKRYGENIIIPNINFEITAGERVVLLGPSGCGKSTLLRIIAGLEEISGGDIYMNDQVVTNVDASKRDVAMVFQNYALYPHMTVEDNITYALKVNKVDKVEINKRLEYVLDALGLEKYRTRKPYELSGGQRQRVALARATVKRSQAFLLDEPLSNLDVQLRVSARKSMLDIHDAFNQTMVYVTHDQIEALTFATKIILLNAGEVQMYDTPYNVYHYPRNVFTASFIGSPAMNLIKDVYIYSDHALKIENSFRIDQAWLDYLDKDKKYIMGIRPEYIKLHEQRNENTALKGIISHIENQGANYAVYIQLEQEMIVSLCNEVNFKANQEVHIELQQNHLHFFDDETELNVGRPEELKHYDLL